MLKDSKQIFSELLNLIEICDYENAKELIEIYLQNDENNVEFLDLYSEILINSDLPQEAIKIIKKSIEIAPNLNGDKYMSLAQLSDYKPALKYYHKGIEIYKNQIVDNSNNVELNISIASGYAALAELYMNTDLW